MSRILVCGLCPLPFENTRQNFGPGIRSWQFARSLAQAGHEVELVAMKIPGAYGEGEPPPREERDLVSVHRLTDVEFMDPSVVGALIEELRPEAVVGATIYGSFALAQCEPIVPFWADQFGHVMAEAQAKAALEGANWPLAHFWNMVRAVATRADKLSTVSSLQRFAAIGELGAIGRLTAESCGYELVEVIPCAVLPGGRDRPPAAVRGRSVPSDAFIVLWSGGYNVWSDVDTLFAGVARAMETEPSVHFVSTGGAIDGHDTATYAAFERKVAASPYGDRFHLEGWVESERVPSYTAEADLGVLTEKPMYEGMLGSKNRILQWMGAGLAVAYNRVGELGDLLAEERLALTFDVGDVDAFAKQIVWATAHPEKVSEMAGRARGAVADRFSFETTARPLVEWAAIPRRSPDAEIRRGIGDPSDFAELRQQAVQRAREVPALRRSNLLRSIWRKLMARG